MVSPLRAWRVSFCALVAMLAVFQFSENTADPDLWGHICFGRRMIETHSIPRAEPYSWTAPGQPWINHEWLSEVALGGAHLLGGGPGVLLLKWAVGLLTFGLCLYLGRAGLAAWALGALAVVEISYGFAARPQIFTALCLAVELVLLRHLYRGRQLWAFALPVLFAIWINLHGGALAGYGLLALAVILMTAQAPRRPRVRQMLPTLWLTLLAAGCALICNPWSTELLRWLIGSMLWMRPEIQEWHATPLGWDHAAFFLLLGLTAYAWAATRRAREWWEMGVCIVFAMLGLVAVRNAPLFAIIALAFVPPHLADALERHRDHWARLVEPFRRPALQFIAAGLCIFGTVGMLFGTFFLHKEHPWTMEVPRNEYPVSAIQFLREHRLTGNAFVFFDWGEELIFECPACPPSIDGRLDTCYPRPLIAATWKAYNEGISGGKNDPFYEAKLALLPANLAGAAVLAKTPGWRVVYYDDLAVILARDGSLPDDLKIPSLPVTGKRSATTGRAAFPDQMPAGAK